MPLLDYSIPTSRGRSDAVAALLSSTPQGGWSKGQLSALADYVLFVDDSGQTGRERREEYPVVTSNRMVTIAKREVPYDDVSRPDWATVEEAVSVAALSDPPPPLPVGPLLSEGGCAAQVDEAIGSLEAQAAAAVGRRRYDLKRAAIAKRKERWLVDCSQSPRMPPPSRQSPVRGVPGVLSGDVVIDEATLMPRSTAAVSLYDERCVRALLRSRRELRSSCDGDFQSDLTFLLLDLDDVLRSLYGHDRVVTMALDLRGDGAGAEEASRIIRDKLGVDVPPHRLAALWQREAPKAVVDFVRRRWLRANWVDPVAGKRKLCRSCGRMLPPHPLWFNRNSSPDGYYSVCRECRSRKRVERITSKTDAVKAVPKAGDAQ